MRILSGRKAWLEWINYVVCLQGPTGDTNTIRKLIQAGHARRQPRQQHRVKSSNSRPALKPHGIWSIGDNLTQRRTWPSPSTSCEHVHKRYWFYITIHITTDLPLEHQSTSDCNNNPCDGQTGFFILCRLKELCQIHINVKLDMLTLLKKSNVNLLHDWTV